MTREEAAPAFSDAIAHLTPLEDRTAIWPAIRLRQRTCVAGIPWPDVMISSCRAVVFRRSAVVVVRDQFTSHITPGGRREGGETAEETTRREVLEETGWRLGPLTPLGFRHFQHLGERPPDFAYPWCDFIQPIFIAEGVSWDRAASDLTQIEIGSSLVPIHRALRDLQPWEAALLQAARDARRNQADA